MYLLTVYTFLQPAGTLVRVTTTPKKRQLASMDPGHGMEARKDVQDVPLVADWLELHAHPERFVHADSAGMHESPHALLARHSRQQI